jgi:hypothetical protein
MIQRVHGRLQSKQAGRRLVWTGWTGVGQLVGGVVHEWFGMQGAARSVWVPPLSIVVHLAWQALESQADRSGDLNSGGVVWIGRRIWPHGRWLIRGRGQHGDDRRLLERSLLVDPPQQDRRLWAIDLAARCPGVVAVIADGSGLDMAGTRRLQLAAEAGGALLLLIRPPWEIQRRSAAATRWRVRCVYSSSAAPRWEIQLVRCKAVQEYPIGRSAAVSDWAQGQPDQHPVRFVAGVGYKELLEWECEQGTVVASPELVDRSDPPAREIRA